MLSEIKRSDEERFMLTEKGERQLYQVAQAMARVSELCYISSDSSAKLSAESMAAIVGCVQNAQYGLVSLKVIYYLE